jgi:pimeloyl-ACP methyl ester carboxylesterase
MRKSVLLSALLLLAAVAVWAAWRYVTPRRLAASPPAVDAEEVRFPSRDGTGLFGLFLAGREGYPGVVLCHGYFRSLAEPFDVGLRLHSEGYSVLLFDFRGCGRSGGRFTTIGYKETGDVLAAVALLKSRLGSGPVGVYGISMGAAAAIMAAARTREIAALIADSPYADLAGVLRRRVRELVPLPGLAPFCWPVVLMGQLMSGGCLDRVRPADWVGRLSPRPILFIYGERDSFVPPDHPRRLFAAAGPPREMWVAPGSDHAAARLDHPEEYMRRLLDFFNRHLRGAAPSPAALMEPPQG